MKPSNAEVELIGGPRDGFIGWMSVYFPPACLPVIEIPSCGFKLIYQARAYDLTECNVFDFVQYIGMNESCLD
jgi:hypothetical protein